MAVGGGEIEVIDGFQLGDGLKRLLAERAFAFEGVQDDALQQVAEGHLVILGKPFQDFHDPLFQAHARLDALDDRASLLCSHAYQG